MKFFNVGMVSEAYIGVGNSLAQVWSYLAYQEMELE